MSTWIFGYQVSTMNNVLSESLAIRRTQTVAVVRDSSLKHQKNVETGQNSKQLREISSEVRSSHPNEMSEDFQVVGHVPKLMAIWLTKFLKNERQTMGKQL